MANTLGMARQARQSNQSDQVSPVLLALQQYGDYMNEPVYGDITLDMDFQFFSNEQEARYEGLDFFQYHWSDPNAAKVAQINEQLGQAFYVYPTPDGSSTFVVVSMGTSSTQAYDMQQGRLRLWMYETGVGNVKPQELQRLMTDLVQLGKHALLINAIGFGVSRSIPFAPVPIPQKEYLNLTDAASSNMLVELSRLLSGMAPATASSQQLFMAVNSLSKPKFKNKWTNALALERHATRGEHFFLVDYGGGKMSIQHAMGDRQPDIVDDESLANIKYDQDPILQYYTNSGMGMGVGYAQSQAIAPGLIANRNAIVKAIEDYVSKARLTQQDYTVLVRQTGRLRELYKSVLPSHVENPLTGRRIKVGGRVYRRTFGLG